MSISMKILTFLCVFLSHTPLSGAWSPGDLCPDEIRVQVPNEHDWVPGYLFDLAALDPYDDSDTPHLASMEDVHYALKSCPNITTLDLRAAFIGCSEAPDRFNFPFDVAGKDRYPALESLSLEGYDFDQVEWDFVQPPEEFRQPSPEDDEKSWLRPWYRWFRIGKAEKWFEWRNLPDTQRLKTNFELWLDAMDFSSLRFLSLKEDWSMTPQGDALIKNLPKMVPSLKELVVGGSWRSEINSEREKQSELDQADSKPRAQEFILGFPPSSLDKLHWTSTGTCAEKDFREVLEHHGSSLISLEWRNPERRYGSRPVFSTSQLRQLGALAPKLESLSIDMNREGTWPLEELTTVVESMPHLSELSVYFEIGSDCQRELERTGDPCHPNCLGLNKYAQPLLNTTEATTLFKHLREHKKGVELTTVVFRSGDWTRGWDGPLIYPDWLEGRRAWSKCDVLRDDGTHKTNSEELCHGKNTMMSGYDNHEHYMCVDSMYGTSLNLRSKPNGFSAKWPSYDEYDSWVGFINLTHSWPLDQKTWGIL